ncbi:MAG: ThiF family adenylyltransferase [Blastocatellia bacterium]|nr:ThiF family adenylyltransferase [Blastocatellia bacterium]
MFHLKNQAEDDDPFERQRRIEWWDQNILRQAKIMVVGAGALGNETLKNLALLGIGKIFILDFDTISGSNLSRTVLFRKQDIGLQKAAVAAACTKEMALEQNAKVSFFHGDLVWDLGLGVYRRMDIVLGCVDNDEARLAINRACFSIGVPWVNAGIQGLSGNVMVFGQEGVCYECNVTADQIEDAHSRYDSCENVKKRYLQQERMPTVQITSALISALQTQEAIKLLHCQTSAVGKRIAFNGFTNNYSVITLQPYDNCMAHGKYQDIKELDLGARSSTLQDLFDRVEVEMGQDFIINLGRRFIFDIKCRHCSSLIELMRPAHRIFDDELICEKCHSSNYKVESQKLGDGAINSGQYIRSIDRISSKQVSSQLLSLSLWDLGIPPLHLISVNNSQKQVTFELTADCRDVLGEFVDDL